MAARPPTANARPGDLLVVVHEFQARSPDELSLARGDRIELIERDDDFGDGWFLGKNPDNGDTGLFPEVYTRPAPRAPATAALHQRQMSHSSAEPRPLQLQQEPHHQPPQAQPRPPSAPATAPAAASCPPPPSTPPRDPASVDAHTTPLHIASASASANAGPSPASQPPAASRTSVGQAPRSLSMALAGDGPRDDDAPMTSPVMNETLSVIDEHIIDMSTPRHSVVSRDLRPNDSGSEYSSNHRLSYLNGHETDEEEQNLHSEREVLTWSPARVAEYLEDVGVEKRHCDIFREQEISGEVLLAMDQATIFLKEFELGPVGPRLRTWLKIKALQQEVKALNEANHALPPALDAPGDPAPDPIRSRATSMGAVLPRIHSLNGGPGSRISAKQPPPRANSSAGHAPAPVVDATSPLVHNTPSSPPPASPARPSAATVRHMNHNRPQSSIDFTVNAPMATTPPRQPPTTHRKTPSFDRNWSMGSPLQPSSQSPEFMRPSSSNHMHSASTDTSREAAFSPVADVDLDRGYFSGGELDNRKNRNVLRKRESPNHSRNPSFGTEPARRNTFSKRHSRVGSTDSVTGSLSPASPAIKAYYGSSLKSHRSSSTFDFVRPLKSINADVPPTVTKLGYADSPSIDAIAKSPAIPGSETSSQGRASPSPAHRSHSFFGKKARSTGLRAISDAITGGEKAKVDIIASPVKESPLQSPARTGSSTPSGTSVSKSLDLENEDIKTNVQKKAKKHGTSAYTRGRQIITPQEAMVGCDYSGWMKKKSSSLMTTWKTRLFVLRGRRLSYFYTENDTEEKGLIDISSHRVLPANNERMTGFHAALTRASSTPTSPHHATIPTAAASDSAKAIDEDVSGMFIFKLVPPRAGLQKGVQFTKPLVHYFAVDNVQQGRLWMAALMKATIDRDDGLNITTTYQQKTISLEKARAMRQRPPALMDEEEQLSKGKRSRESLKLDANVIHEEDEKLGLAIAGLGDAKLMLDFADGAAEEAS